MWSIRNSRCRRHISAKSKAKVSWNKIYINAALEQLRQEGYPVLDEYVPRLSPFVHERWVS